MSNGTAIETAKRALGGRRSVRAGKWRRAVGVLGVVMLMPVPAAASAQSAGEAPNPSVNQYLESVPRARGGKPATGKTDRKANEVPTEVRRKLAEEGGADAAALDAITRSGRLGASPRASVPDGEPARPGAGDKIASEPSAVRAASTAAGEGSARWLLAGLAAIAVAAGVLALRRRRA